MNGTDNLHIRDMIDGGYGIYRRYSAAAILVYSTQEEAQSVLDSWRNADKVAKERDELKIEVDRLAALLTLVSNKTISTPLDAVSNLSLEDVNQINNHLDKYK